MMTCDWEVNFTAKRDFFFFKFSFFFLQIFIFFLQIFIFFLSNFLFFQFQFSIFQSFSWINVSNCNFCSTNLANSISKWIDLKIPIQKNWNLIHIEKQVFKLWFVPRISTARFIPNILHNSYAWIEIKTKTKLWVSGTLPRCHRLSAVQVTVYAMKQAFNEVAPESACHVISAQMTLNVMANSIEYAPWLTCSIHTLSDSI